MNNEFKSIVTIANNAICFLREENMTEKEIADYLGVNVELLRAINDEDYDKIVKLSNKRKKELENERD